MRRTIPDCAILSKNTRPLLALHSLFSFALMSLIWGLTWAAVKFGLEQLPPLLLAAARYLLAATLLMPMAKEANAAFSDGRWRRTVASALLINTGTYGLLFWGMQSVPSGLSGLVNLALVPVMLFALAMLTGEEKASLWHTAALVVGCAGLVVLFWPRLSGEDVASGSGLLAIVAATACYCLGSIVAKPLVGPVKPLALTLVQAAIGGTALLSLSLTTESLSPATFEAFANPVTLGSVIFLSLLGTIVAYTLYLTLLRDWGAARASLYAFVSPIVALASGAWLFDESIGAPEVSGAILLLIAAGLALLRPRTASS